MTVWPGMPLGPVDVDRRALTVSKRGKLKWGAKPQAAELPDEWVLRQLADADLESDRDIEALLADFGTIDAPYPHAGFVPADRRARLAPQPSLVPHGWWAARQDGTLEDARWWLKTARAMTGVWSEASRGEDPGSAWAAEGFPALAATEPGAQWTFFVTALNDGLSAFHVHAEYEWDLANLGLGAITYGRPLVNLYSAACRQVFNFLVEGETGRRCENQTCGRTFVRQLGGAEHGQHRSDARYCTPECARAEASRQYRRRKTAQREEQQS
jgi:hypothetical protein